MKLAAYNKFVHISIKKMRTLNFTAFISYMMLSANNVKNYYRLHAIYL